MQKSLDDVAEVRTLLVFRDKAPILTEQGDAVVFNSRDLISSWPLDFATLPQVSVDSKKLESAIRTGDILLPGRGQAYPARLFTGSPIPALPSGQVYVIRAVVDSVMPEYLAWYINRPVSQNFILRSLTGTTIQALNKSALQKMQIDIPPMEVQFKIVRLQGLFERRSQIHNELLKIERTQFEVACNEMLARSNHE